MTQSKRLAKEYEQFVKQFGYEPATFATSLEEVRNRIHSAPLSEKDRERRSLEWEMFLSGCGSKATSQENMKLDPSGYGKFLDDVVTTSSINRVTTDIVYCGEFPTNEFNASARAVRTGHLILLNRGLRQLLYNLSLAVCYHIKDRNELTSAIAIPRSREWGEIAIYVIGIILNYFKGQLSFNWNGCKHTQDCLIASSGLSGAMRSFVVAHEVAHAEMGHLDDNRTFHIKTPLGDIEIISKSYDQEFEADLLAQQVSIEIARNERAVGIVCGGVAFIMIDGIIELARARFFNQYIEQSSTHPLAEYRLTALMEYIKANCSALEYQWCQQALAIFVQVIEIVEQANITLNDGKISVSFDIEDS